MASRARLRATDVPPPASQPRVATPVAGDRVSNIRRLRQWKRNQVRLAATVTGPGGSEAVTVQDISRHGAGLVGVALCEREHAVSLDFGNGRILAAHVRWRIGLSAGLAFEAALPEDDPLLSGLLAPASRPAAAPPVTAMSPRMLARACREQGFAWLTEFDDE